MSIEIEYDQWLIVRTTSPEMARKFFGVPDDQPVELDESGAYKVLSPAWQKQQQEKV